MAPSSRSTSLTPPSPTPPPTNPVQSATNGASGSKAKAPTALDSESDLSSLTEDDDHRVHDDDDDEDKPLHSGRAVRRTQRNTLPASRRRRSGIDPGRPWDWAKVKKAKAKDEDSDDEHEPGNEEQDEDGDGDGDGEGDGDGDVDGDIDGEDDEDQNDPEEEEGVEELAQPEDPLTALATAAASQNDAPENGVVTADDEDEDDVDHDYEDDENIPEVRENGLVALAVAGAKSDIVKDDAAGNTIATPVLAETMLPLPKSYQDDDGKSDGDVEDQGRTKAIASPKRAGASPAVEVNATGDAEEDEEEDEEPEEDEAASAPLALTKPVGFGLLSAAPKSPTPKTPTPSPEPSPSPEPEPQEEDEEMDVAIEESDLQPADRAEALDVLAGIELKFALLRERLFIEKMEELSAEEQMIQNRTHPELIHLHAELMKRRTRRLELGERKRKRDEEVCKMRRRTDENAVWSWWKHERDELQTEIGAEINRKRRRLDREYKQQTRPIPLRRIPAPSQAIHLSPVSLDELLEAKYSRTVTPTQDHYRRLYPGLSMLSAQEIVQDLDYMQPHRSRRPIVPPPVMPDVAMADTSLPLGPGMGMYPVDNASIAGPSSMPMPTFRDNLAPQHAQQQPMQIQQMMPPNFASAPPHRQPQPFHPPPPPPPPTIHPSRLEHPPVLGGSRLPPPPPPMHSLGMGMGMGMHGHPPMRRTPSPPPASTHAHVPQPSNGWNSGVNSIPSSNKINGHGGWKQEDELAMRERELARDRDHRDREREREQRERELRDREREQREYDRSQFERERDRAGLMDRFPQIQAPPPPNFGPGSSTHQHRHSTHPQTLAHNHPPLPPHNGHRHSSHHHHHHISTFDSPPALQRAHVPGLQVHHHHGPSNPRRDDSGTGPGPDRRLPDALGMPPPPPPPPSRPPSGYWKPEDEHRELERERDHRVRERDRDRDAERRVPGPSHMSFQPPSSSSLSGSSLMSPGGAGLRTSAWNNEHEARRPGSMLSPQHSRRSPPPPLRRVLTPPLTSHLHKGPGVGPPTSTGSGTYALPHTDRSVGGRGDHLNLAPIMPSQMQPAMPPEMGNIVPAVGGQPKA